MASSSGDSASVYVQYVSYITFLLTACGLDTGLQFHHSSRRENSPKPARDVAMCVGGGAGKHRTVPREVKTVGNTWTESLTRRLSPMT